MPLAQFFFLPFSSSPLFLILIVWVCFCLLKFLCPHSPNSFCVPFKVYLSFCSLSLCFFLFLTLPLCVCLSLFLILSFSSFISLSVLASALSSLSLPSVSFGPCFQSLWPLLTHFWSYFLCPLVCTCFWCYFSGPLSPCYCLCSLCHSLFISESPVFSFLSFLPSPSCLIPSTSSFSLPFPLVSLPPLSFILPLSLHLSQFYCSSLSFSLFPSFFRHGDDSCPLLHCSGSFPPGASNPPSPRVLLSSPPLSIIINDKSSNITSVISE